MCWIELPVQPVNWCGWRMGVGETPGASGGIVGTQGS